MAKSTELVPMMESAGRDGGGEDQGCKCARDFGDAAGFGRVWKLFESASMADAGEDMEGTGGEEGKKTTTQGRLILIQRCTRGKRIGKWQWCAA